MLEEGSKHILIPKVLDLVTPKPYFYLIKVLVVALLIRIIEAREACKKQNFMLSTEICLIINCIHFYF